MLRYWLHIIVPLIICLFIYLFYRTDHTAINQLILFIAPEKYNYLKESITNTIALPHFVIYSLPEGLWVYSVTVACVHLYFPFLKQKIFLTIAPLIFSLALECMQYLEWINGRFDVWDIVSALSFSLLAMYIFKNHFPKYNIMQGVNFRMAVSVVCFAVVYLAHVFG